MSELKRAYDTPDALFLKFLELVRASYAHNYPLSQFALLLGTTEAKLNEQAKLHAGKTAQNVIYGLIVSEAKRLLTYENLTVKEGDYLYTPPGFKHSVKSETGCTILFIVPEEVEILQDKDEKA